jgi:hypothetical protein
VKHYLKESLARQKMKEEALSNSSAQTNLMEDNSSFLVTFIADTPGS